MPDWGLVGTLRWSLRLAFGLALRGAGGRVQHVSPFARVMESEVGGGFAVVGRPLAPVLADSSPPGGWLLARSRSGLAPTPLAARFRRHRL